LKANGVAACDSSSPSVRSVKPFELAVALLLALNKLYPNSLGWNDDFFDKLAGTNQLRQMIQRNKSIESILNTAKKSRSSFEQKRYELLLY
jgi:uncharacterized protein YbbC (DUF1343 family)